MELIHTTESKVYLTDADPNTTKKVISGENVLKILFERETIAILAFSFDKYNNYLGFLGLHNTNNQNESQVEEFLREIQRFGRKVLENKIRKLHLYYFLDIKGGHYYDLQQKTIQNFFYHNVLKYIPRIMVKIVTYNPLSFDYYSLMYDFITRSVSFSGVNSLEEQLFFSIEGKKFIKA